MGKSLARRSRSATVWTRNVYHPETGLVASSTREGTIHIFHEDSPDKLSVVETVMTELGAKTMALDPKSHLTRLLGSIVRRIAALLAAAG
jgi:hypothetical protein